mgnify:CR=1 FL=1
MRKSEKSPREGIYAFPPFPVVLVTVRDSIVTVGAVHLFSFNPPMYQIGIIPKSYSYELLEEAKEFIINIPTKGQIEILEFCGTTSGRDVDKFQKLGLTPQRGKIVEAMLIKECPVNIECKVLRKIDLGGSHIWFIGKIVAVHMDKNYDKLATVAYGLERKYREVGKVIYTRPKKQG